MRKSQFTDRQIAFAPRQSEGGTPVPKVCRKKGVSEPTFFRWRQQYGGLMPSGCSDCGSSSSLSDSQRA